MQLPYREIILPSLVNDVKDIFEFVEKVSKNLYVEFDYNDPTYQPLINITTKYPFLSNHLAVFKISPGSNTNIHLDGLENTFDRKTACNIPISGCVKESITEFFDLDKKYIYSDLDSLTRYVVPNAPTPNKLCEYSLTTNPILCASQIPHKVTNVVSNEIRVSVSWTVNPEWSWDMISSFARSMLTKK